MGQPDLFAKATFAEEAERVTRGAATWLDPPEIRLEKVQSDGMLLIRRPDLLMSLSAPWPAARLHDEIVVELKLAGDHVDRKEIETALLRRQARQVQRVKEAEDSGAPPWLGHQPLWLVAPHVPGWLSRVYEPASFAPGCYRVAPLGDWFLWIAANELPLQDDLVPFLLARSGRALDEFARWVAPRRPLEWMLTMLECLSMSTSVREDLLWRFGEQKDPEVEARRQRILEVLLETSPKTKQQLIDQGQLVEARVALREVLARRRLTPAPDDEARIEACDDLATLRRWLGQAATAASISEALQ